MRAGGQQVSMKSGRKMHFRHSAEIWERFPTLVPGVLIVDEIRPDVTIDSYLEPWYERARGRLARETESSLPEIAAWRRAFARMGFKPTQYRSAAEALLRRFRRDQNLPRLHPLVDVCNAISLAFAVPVAVFDLARIERSLEVRSATGVEQYLGFDERVEIPPRGEIVFADEANQAHARRWTYRQSRRSVVNDGTSQALIAAEGLHRTAIEDVNRLLDALTRVLSDQWSAPQKRAVLTASEPTLFFARTVPQVVRG